MLSQDTGMTAFAMCAAVALALAPPATAPGSPPPAASPSAESQPKIPPAALDDSLEITGDALAAELGSRMFIDARVNGEGPFRFLVDSGADRSVIGAALALRLKLPVESQVVLQGMAGSSTVGTVFVDRLTLGASTINGVVAPSLPERFLGAQGIIGIDALAEQRLMLDFDARTVTIEDRRRPVVQLEGEIVVTARRRKGQLILTQASVGGGRIFAVIDTGSDITVGNSALRRKVFGGRRPPEAKTITLLSVTGQSFEAQLAVLPEVRIGGVLLQNVQVAFADAPPFALFGLDTSPSLLLGTDLLRSFRRLSLDFGTRRVRFQLRR